MKSDYRRLNEPNLLQPPHEKEKSRQIRSEIKEQNSKASNDLTIAGYKTIDHKNVI